MNLPAPLLRALKQRRLIRRLDLTSRMIVGSHTFKVPLLGGGLSNLKQEEGWLIPVLSVLLKQKAGAFLDVGMNVGQTMLKFLAIENGGRTYYGFEPNPMAVAYAYRLIRTNEAQNVEIVPVGLSDRTSVVSFYMKSEFDTSASAVGGFRDSSYYNLKRHIAVMRGDDVIQNLGINEISVLKIDVEGGELEVLLGLAETIKRARPFISCEVLPIRSTETENGRFRRSRADRIEAFVAENDYRICRVRNDGVVEEMSGIPTHDDLSLCEYLFLPQETAKGVIEALSAKTK